MIRTQRISDARSYGMIKALLSSDGVDGTKIDGAKITVRGFSMSPFIKDGAIVTLKRFDKSKNLCIGDVIAATSECGNGVLVHRVIGLKKNLILLKGDNNLHNDGWMPESCVIGLVEKIDGSGPIKNNYSAVNFLIAKGSASGWFNRLLFPALRATRNALVRPTVK